MVNVDFTREFDFILGLEVSEPQSRYNRYTGWGISLRTVGVASKPVKPHLLSLFYSAMYIACTL